MATVIHPTAIVEPGAQLGLDCEIMAHAIVTRHCTLGDRVVVHPFAVLGGDPQYLKFDRATTTGVRIGSGSVIREHVTINRSIHAGQVSVADGTPLAAQKLERVLTNDPGMGVIRHCDAGYAHAQEVAIEKGVHVPMMNGVTGR